MSDVLDCPTIADQGVLDRVVIGIAKAHASDKDLIIWNAKMTKDRLLLGDPGGYWLGIQAKTLGRQHNGLGVHARICPIAPRQIGVDGNEKPDRRVEEFEVPAALASSPLPVTFDDTQQPIKPPADTAPAIAVHVGPRGGVVVVFLVGLGLTGSGKLKHIVGGHLLDVAGAQIDMPGLRVDAAWCALGDLQDLIDDLAGHWIWLEGADRSALRDSIKYVHLTILPWVDLHWCEAISWSDYDPLGG